ncbi:MAG: ribosome maturation factor RimM [Desulfovibrio sp.]|nr:ribosome maturation factor RimM [Desulfovibrio sp.]MCA1985563.1 ribosome maturation factor RimM [Desulfovibrio sp.]
MASQLVLGRVLKPHGVRGELKCACHAEDLDAFLALPRLWLARDAAEPRAFVVRKARPASPDGQTVLLLLEGIADRTQADTWRDADILANTADLPPPDEDEVYIEDLLGAEVLLADGTALGVFEYLLETAQEYDVWAIRTPAGQEILVPSHEDFLVEVDAEARRIVVDPPQGLVDIYLADQSPEPSPKEARHDRSPHPHHRRKAP